MVLQNPGKACATIASCQFGDGSPGLALRFLSKLEAEKFPVRSPTPADDLDSGRTPKP